MGSINCINIKGLLNDDEKLTCDEWFSRDILEIQYKTDIYCIELYTVFNLEKCI